MKKLEKYAFKYVDVVDIDDIEYKHYYAGVYTSAADNDDENEVSLDLFPTKGAKKGIGLFASEIKSIELAAQ